VDVPDASTAVRLAWMHPKNQPLIRAELYLGGWLNEYLMHHDAPVCAALCSCSHAARRHSGAVPTVIDNWQAFHIAVTTAISLSARGFSAEPNIRINDFSGMPTWPARPPNPIVALLTARSKIFAVPKSPFIMASTAS
jgi:hypothetical protein